MTTECKASSSEEPGAGIPHAGICAGGARQRASLPRYLLSDGRFTYTWDAENRLIGVTTRDDLPAAVPRVKVDYLYDHQSRRIVSSTAVWTNDAWQAVESSAFLYDGWNVVKETLNHQQSTTNYYTWGLDLSGSLQGAGGIGGLLAANLDGTTALYRYDANGNVGQLVATNGDLLAHYEYDPFGNTVVATGVDATDNPFRFSTKWFDNDTGLGYWGYRWYSPGMGRWISRDPLGRRGSLAAYLAVGNRPPNGVDAVGLKYSETVELKPLSWLTETYKAHGYTTYEGQMEGPSWLGPVPLTGEDLIEESTSMCCATVKRAKIHDLKVTTYNPQDRKLVVNGPDYFTENGLQEVAGHEGRRREVYSKADAAYFIPIEGTGDVATRCGTVCYFTPGAARSVLQAYLSQLRTMAWQLFKSYVIFEQLEIYKEYMLSDSPFAKPDIPDPMHPLDHYVNVHSVADPKPATWPDCPLHIGDWL